MPVRAALATSYLAFLVPLACLAESDALHVDLGDQFNLQLVAIEPGSFVQGSRPDEPGHRPDEMQHEVRLTRKFYLGKYPVTCRQYARFVNETGYRTEAEAGVSGGFGWGGEALVQRKEFNCRTPGFPQTDDDPVTIVTFADAKAFLRWLSQKSNREFKLPAEAEWEYACRAGTDTPWPNGADAAAADALSWNKANAGNATHPVGQKAPNAWGLSDMLGNVWEWCEDWYGPYQSGLAVDPVQMNSKLSDKPRRVLRGGSWLRDRMDCRSAARYRNDPASRNADNGFRVLTYASGGAQTPTIQVERASAIFSKRPALAGRRSVSFAEPREGYAQAGMGGIFIVMVIVGVGFALFRSLFGGGTGNVSGPGNFIPGGGVSTRTMDDGFWIAGNLPRGTPLLCRYDVGSGMQETRIAFEPGPDGHFVYTGRRPFNITVVTQSASMDTYSDSDVVIQNVPPIVSSYSDPHPSEPPYQGPPPAY